MEGSTSDQIKNWYTTLTVNCDSDVLETKVKFSQEQFLKDYKPQESLLDDPEEGKKGLLQDDHVERASNEGFCAAAVLNWLSTGKVPAQDTVSKLSTMQHYYATESQKPNTIGIQARWYEGVPEMALASKLPLKEVKDSRGFHKLTDTKTFIDYLLDKGEINPKSKLLLGIVFTTGGGHAIGLDLETRQLFDPNKGVFKIKTTAKSVQGAKSDVANLIYAVFGAKKIWTEYAASDVIAFTFKK